MGEWFEHLGGIESIAPIESDHLRSWPDAAFAGDLPRLRFVPVVESELQLAAHHLPLTLRRAPLGWEVVADLQSTGVKRPAFSAAGKWRLGYKPMMLRLLPFAVSSTNQIFRLFGSNDQPVQRSRAQMESVQKHLITLYNGRKLAAARAEKLLLEGWVEPAQDDVSKPLISPWGRFSELAITASNWDAAELLLILAFSQKQLLGHAPLRSMILERPTLPTLAGETARTLPNFLDWDQSLSFDL